MCILKDCKHCACLADCGGRSLIDKSALTIQRCSYMGNITKKKKSSEEE